MYQVQTNKTTARVPDTQTQNQVCASECLSWVWKREKQEHTKETSTIPLWPTDAKCLSLWWIQSSMSGFRSYRSKDQKVRSLKSRLLFNGSTFGRDRQVSSALCQLPSQEDCVWKCVVWRFGPLTAYLVHSGTPNKIRTTFSDSKKA